MRKKIISIFFCTLLITTVIPLSVYATDPDPQITDESGDAFGYIDIDSVWFFENEETPEFLYISEKINEPSNFVPQQTFAVFWAFNGMKYFCALHMGFSLTKWKQFTAGTEIDSRYDEIIHVNGTYDFETGVITWKIPKEIIGNPKAGDVLTDIWSNAFRRLGIIGRIGLIRTALDVIVLLVFGNNMWDYAPAKGEYGLDYIIQYSG